MNSLRSQTIEVSAASAVAVASVAAALTGALFGFLAARRSLTFTGASEVPAEPERSHPEWRRIAEAGYDDDEARKSVEAVRRDYELDIGLLKQEIQRLAEIVSLATRVPGKGTESSGSDSNGSSNDAGEQIRYSSLEHLSSQRPRGGPDL